MLSFVTLRMLLAVAVLVLFDGLCLAAPADNAHAVQVLTIVAPLVTVVLMSLSFGQRRG